MQKIVTIGGGTGQYQILRGLKNYECEISAVVNMADNGGSSGRLRDEFGILPPGDARQCLVALCDEERGRILRELFNYRFDRGHNLGNLIITALSKISGGTAEGIREAGKLLGVSGKVLPVTLDNVVLHGKTPAGKVLTGQTEVSYPEDRNTRIQRIYYDVDAFAYCEAANSIRAAEKVVICPGELYGSVLPNFLVKGIPEALRETKAVKIYVCNLFTKEGTQGFAASDFVREIERYSQISLDRIVINTGKPSADVLKKYLSEKSALVKDDIEGDWRVIRGDYVASYPSENKTLLRHVPEKIARVIVSV